MTETEWLICPDPDLMLDYLRGKTTERKLRLFACACCRKIWDCLVDARSRKSVEVSERFADGSATRQELNGAYNRADKAFLTLGDAAAKAAREVSSENDVAAWTSRSASKAMVSFEDPAWIDERKSQCVLLQDIIGNPFHAVFVSHSWLAWNDGAIRKIAQTIYDDRAFDRLPILADALEDAGCDDADILSHCRAPGEHVRGCWVVDLLLGKS